MRIVYYTSGTTGIGRLVTGMAIGNALLRKGVSHRYTILHSSPLGHLAGDFDNQRVPIETERDLSPANYRKSVLFKTLKRLKPDVLLVNHQWFMIQGFIREIPAKKIYLSDQAFDHHFRVPLPAGEIAFDPEPYDRVFAIEPFESAIPMERIEPVILKNRDEILPRETAIERLRLDGAKPVALYALSGRPEYFERYREKYAYLDSEYDVVRTTTFREGLFPAVDYFNAIDLIVCGAGYNQVWESVYFGKKATFEILDVNFSDQAARLEAAAGYRFNENGADRLVEIIRGL